MRARAARFAAVLSVVFAATPVQASDFSGFSTFVLIIGLAFAVMGWLLGLILAKFAPISLRGLRARASGKLALFAFSFGLLFLLGFTPFALAAVIIPALATWLLLSAKNSKDRLDEDAR